MDASPRCSSATRTVGCHHSITTLQCYAWLNMILLVGRLLLVLFHMVRWLLLWLLWGSL